MLVLPDRVVTEENADEQLSKLVTSSMLLSMLLLREKLGLEGIGSLMTCFNKKVDGFDSLPSFRLFVCPYVLFANVQRDSSPLLYRPTEYDRFIVKAHVATAKCDMMKGNLEFFQDPTSHFEPRRGMNSE